MNNDTTSTCTCTTAYFRPDDNQWEPSHKCESCMEEDAYLEHEMSQLDLYTRQRVEDDDLPF